MPFDERWFYGDTFFIIDPWMWLLMGSAVVFARSSSRLSMAGWVILGSGMTALVTTASQVPVVAKWLWIAGITAIVWLRVRKHSHSCENRPIKGSIPPTRVARTALVLFGTYLGWMLIASTLTSAGVERWLEERGEQVVTVMPKPLPADPFLRHGVAETEEYYYLFRYRMSAWGGKGTFELRHEPVPKPEPDPVIEAALKAGQVRGLVNWMRFPVFEKEQLEDGWLVRIKDLRFVEPGEGERDNGSGIGIGIVRLDRELNPVEE
jgi:inner membrane protein